MAAKKKYIHTILLSLTVFVLNAFLSSAHAEVTLATPKQDKQAKQAAPPHDQALIYIFRDENPVAEAAVPVMLDGRRIGETGPHMFLLAAVSPGMHYLISGDKIIATLRLECEPGKTYFVAQRALAGFYPVRTELNLVDGAVGRKAIDQSQLAAAGSTVPSSQESNAPKSGTRDAKPASSQSSSQSALALILKGGGYRMSEQAQVVGGLISLFDTKSTGVGGIEVEWRARNGFAGGGELYTFNNTVVPFGTTLKAKMDTIVFMINAKKYFAIADFFYPYVGAGIGFATATLSGDATGSSSGYGSQAMAGVEFRIKNVGLYLELKRLYSTIDDSSGETTKIGGTGENIGLSISFDF